MLVGESVYLSGTLLCSVFEVQMLCSENIYALLLGRGGVSALEEEYA